MGAELLQKQFVMGLKLLGHLTPPVSQTFFLEALTVFAQTKSWLNADRYRSGAQELAEPAMESINHDRLRTCEYGFI